MIQSGGMHCQSPEHQGYFAATEAGCPSLAVLRDAHGSGARRGTIHTQPMRPEMLTTAALTKAAAK